MEGNKTNVRYWTAPVAHLRALSELASMPAGMCFVCWMVSTSSEACINYFNQMFASAGTSLPFLLTRDQKAWAGSQLKNAWSLSTDALEASSTTSWRTTERRAGSSRDRLLRTSGMDGNWMEK